MNKRDVVKVRASEILGSPETKGIVLKVLHEIGHKDYPFGLLLVQCIDDPLGIYGNVDFQGYVYTGPPSMDGILARFP